LGTAFLVHALKGVAIHALIILFAYRRNYRISKPVKYFLPIYRKIKFFSLLVGAERFEKSFFVCILKDVFLV